MEDDDPEEEVEVKEDVETVDDMEFERERIE